jgi:endonuclease/exonuclease/phosphatase family metal-dependent hydrolase
VWRTIDRFQPDVLATQEGLDFQLRELHRLLDGYTFLGAGRDDGRTRGEFAAIFLRRPRFQVTDHGHFWLSETPDTAGSRGWDAGQPRMATWCTLRDNEAPDEPLHVLNTHFDYRGEAARLHSAQLLRRRWVSPRFGRPLVVLGDFNCDADDPPYRALVNGDGSRDPGIAADTRRPASEKLVDAYRTQHPRDERSAATRHDFGRQTVGARMDWILHSQRLVTLDAAIDRTEYEGRYPSDHFPVTAVLRMDRPPSPAIQHKGRPQWTPR